jgi:hypothetical protein
MALPRAAGREVGFNVDAAVKFSVRKLRVFWRCSFRFTFRSSELSGGQRS